MAPLSEAHALLLMVRALCVCEYTHTVHVLSSCLGIDRVCAQMLSAGLSHAAAKRADRTTRSDAAGLGFVLHALAALSEFVALRFVHCSLT